MTTTEEQPDRERLARLPRWAQDEILRLRANVANLEAKLSAGPDNSNAFLNPNSSAPTPLGRDPYIKYVDDPERGNGFGVQYKDGQLIVQGTGSWDQTFVVRPQAANAVTIEHIRKDD